jgi:hypothetical protein
MIGSVFVLILTMIGFYLQWAVCIVLALLFLIFLWADKHILAAMDAGPLDHKLHWNDVVKNFAVRLNVGRVDPYLSHRFPNNVYAVASHQSCSLVIGRRILETLNPTEINAILFATILLLKNNQVRSNTIISLFLLITYFPFSLLNKIRSRWATPWVKFILNLYFTALIYLRTKVEDKNIFQSIYPELSNSLDDLGPLSSALIKISQIVIPDKDVIMSGLMENLVIVKNLKKDAIFNLMRDNVPQSQNYLTNMQKRE